MTPLESLEHAIQALALGAAEQRALFPPFVCVADELALDFEAALNALPDRAFSPTESAALLALDAFVDAVSGPDNAAVWEDAALDDHPAWIRIRALAREVLVAFGWACSVPARNGAIYVAANGVLSEVSRNNALKNVARRRS